MGVFCEAYNRGLWIGEVRVVDKTSFACFCDGSGRFWKGAEKGPLCRGTFFVRLKITGFG